MNPRITRSLPYWILVIGSVVSAAFGVAMALMKIFAMTNALNANTATGLDVYAGQAWVFFSVGFITAGLIGLVVALALAVVAKFFDDSEIDLVEAIDWNEESDDSDLDFTEPSYTTEPPLNSSTPATAAPTAPESAADDSANRA